MNPEYENLINSLIKDGYLKTPEIVEAFKAMERYDFVPEECKGDACVNIPLPIGFDQTISQPLTVAFMVELLEPKHGEKILEIGAGSSWQTAILAYIVSQNLMNTLGKVVAIERIPELKDFALKNIAKYGFVEKGVVEIIQSDGSKGHKTEAPYDKIIAGAAAQGDVPIDWKKQLKMQEELISFYTSMKKAKSF